MKNERQYAEGYPNQQYFYNLYVCTDAETRDEVMLRALLHKRDNQDVYVDLQCVFRENSLLYLMPCIDRTDIFEDKYITAYDYANGTYDDWEVTILCEKEVLEKAFAHRDQTWERIYRDGR